MLLKTDKRGLLRTQVLDTQAAGHVAHYDRVRVDELGRGHVVETRVQEAVPLVERLVGRHNRLREQRPLLLRLNVVNHQTTLARHQNIVIETVYRSRNKTTIHYCLKTAFTWLLELIHFLKLLNILNKKMSSHITKNNVIIEMIDTRNLLFVLRFSNIW